VSEEVSDLAHSSATLGVVVAYGALIPSAILDAMPMLNAHFSLLPRWRGAAPVERAILAGDEITGVCVMGLEATLDTGPVYARASTPIDHKSADELRDELAGLGAVLLVDVVSRDALPTPQVQTGEATYARKLSREDFILDPHDDVTQLERIVRLGRAETWIDARRVRVLAATITPGSATIPGRAAVVEGALELGARGGSLRLERVRPEGSRDMDGAAWWRGLHHDVTSAPWGRRED
jgi:methionyl-tRNA formyltransferase